MLMILGTQFCRKNNSKMKPRKDKRLQMMIIDYTIISRIRLCGLKLLQVSPT